MSLEIGVQCEPSAYSCWSKLDPQFLRTLIRIFWCILARLTAYPDVRLKTDLFKTEIVLNQTSMGKGIKLAET